MAHNNPKASRKEIQGGGDAGTSSNGRMQSHSTEEAVPTERHFQERGRMAGEPQQGRSAGADAVPDAASKKEYRPQIAMVTIGKIRMDDSFRADPAKDVESLVGSLDRVGLLHLPVVTPDLHLVAGGRRLLALKARGYTTTMALIAPFRGKEMLIAKRDENTERVDPTIDEKMRLAEAIEPTIKAEARERRRQHAKGKGASSHARRRWERTRDQVAKAARMSDRTLRKARVIEASGRADLIEKMRRTGKVDGAYKELKVPQSLDGRVRAMAARLARVIPDLEKVLEEALGAPDLDPNLLVTLFDPLQKISQLAEKVRVVEIIEELPQEGEEGEGADAPGEFASPKPPGPRDRSALTTRDKPRMMATEPQGRQEKHGKGR